jgi:hypothetical protein
MLPAAVDRIASVQWDVTTSFAVRLLLKHGVALAIQRRVRMEHAEFTIARETSRVLGVVIVHTAEGQIVGLQTMTTRPRQSKPFECTRTDEQSARRIKKGFEEGRGSWVWMGRGDVDGKRLSTHWASTRARLCIERHRLADLTQRLCTDQTTRGWLGWRATCGPEQVSDTRIAEAFILLSSNVQSR